MKDTETKLEAKTDRKSRYTRKVLQDSFIELMRQQPVAKITIKELCELADVNRTTFYAHYKDQYDLLRQIEEETMAYFVDMLKKYENKRSRREVIEMVEGMMAYIASNSNSIQTLLSENGDIDFQKQLFNCFNSQEQIKSYFDVKTLDNETKAYFLVFIINGTIGLMQHWLKNKMSMPVQNLAKVLIKLCQHNG